MVVHHAATVARTRTGNSARRGSRGRPPGNVSLCRQPQADLSEICTPSRAVPRPGLSTGREGTEDPRGRSRTGGLVEQQAFVDRLRDGYTKQPRSEPRDGAERWNNAAGEPTDDRPRSS